MRSMVEGASAGAAIGIRPLHRLRRSPSPASRVRNHSYKCRMRATAIAVTNNVTAISTCSTMCCASGGKCVP